MLTILSRWASASLNLTAYGATVDIAELYSAGDVPPTPALILSVLGKDEPSPVSIGGERRSLSDPSGRTIGGEGRMPLTFPHVARSRPTRRPGFGILTQYRRPVRDGGPDGTVAKASAMPAS